MVYTNKTRLCGVTLATVSLVYRQQSLKFDFVGTGLEHMFTFD